jgi:hypothetical protein
MENTMIEAFHLGGWGMFPTTLFGVLLLAASIRYAFSPDKRFVPLQVSLGIITLASGGLGFVTGVIKSFMAIDGVGADMKWIWMLGVGESLHNVAAAFALVTIGAIAASIGAYRIARAAPSAAGSLAA